MNVKRIISRFSSGIFGLFNRGIRFVRESGSTDALTFGEPLAIYVEGGKYLKYGSREYGINLVWSDTPVFEWEFRGAPGRGKLVPSQPVGLFNRATKDYVIYCEREYGINLRWLKDCKRGPVPPPEFAPDLDVTLKLPGTQSAGDCSTSGRARFTMTPLRDVHVGVGRPNGGNWEITWSKPAGCLIKKHLQDIEPGVWKLEAENFLGWKSSCEIEIKHSFGVKRYYHADFVVKSSGCLYY